MRSFVVNLDSGRCYLTLHRSFEQLSEAINFWDPVCSFNSASQRFHAYSIDSASYARTSLRKQ
jgi:hypothetical protein